jgi:energy-coupling factor transporter ATP-binding protein EcfA2
VARVTELQIEDFKKITFVALTLRPGVTEISGPNGAGKSSTFDAIDVLLEGLAVAPAEPIRKGATRTRIRGRIGEMYVERTIRRTPKGKLETTIKLQPIEGKAYPATQRQLDDFIQQHDLDSTDFLKLDARGKFDAFRAFVPGYDFDTTAKEDAADYSRRTECNTLAKEARAAAGLIFVPPGTPDEEIAIAALETKFDEAHKKNLAESERKLRREGAEAQIAQHRKSAEDHLAQMVAVRADKEANRDSELASIDEQIKVLQLRREQVLATTETAIAEEESRLKRLADASTTAANELQAKLNAGKAIEDPIDTDAIRKEIDEARKTNANVARLIQKRKHTSTAERYEAESQALTGSMAAREKAKRDAIAAAKLPVPGIEFGNGELLLNGVPFDQASTAQKFRVCVAVAVARRPNLRLVWIRDGSLLDDETFASLDPLAQEFDCDILVETVRPIGSNVVVLENGHVKDGPEQAPAEAAA